MERHEIGRSEKSARATSTLLFMLKGQTGGVRQAGVTLRASTRGALQWNAAARSFNRTGKIPVVPQRLGISTTMAAQEPERTAEAVRRSLPQAKLDPELPCGATKRSGK